MPDATNLNYPDASQHLLYATEKGVRASFGGSASDAARFYSDYLGFVKAVAPPTELSSSLLDVGCGCGWSSYFLAEGGYATVGVDLNPEAFEPAKHEHLSLRYGSALELPFSDEAFDIVASYQCLEHIPDPRRALHEMLRVLKPGGAVIIVGPNLVSPVLPIKLFISDCMTGRLTYRRLPSTPRHPYGNTAFEFINGFFRSNLLMLRKIFTRNAVFTMRTPDPLPPFHGDNDACYLCNPIDLLRYFRAEGCSKIRNGKPGRPPGSWLLAGGTWIAFRKSGLSS